MLPRLPTAQAQVCSRMPEGNKRYRNNQKSCIISSSPEASPRRMVWSPAYRQSGKRELHNRLSQDELSFNQRIYAAYTVGNPAGRSCTDACSCLFPLNLLLPFSAPYFSPRRFRFPADAPPDSSYSGASDVLYK